MLLISHFSFKIALRRQMKRFNVLPIAASVLLLSGGFFILSYGEAVKGTFKDIVYDVTALFLSVVEQPFNSLQGYQDNVKRHLLLQKQAHVFEKLLTELKTYKAKAHNFEMRNRELRDLLALQGTGDDLFMTAQCFGQQAVLPTQSLFIHAGKQSGIQRFDVVLSEGSIIGQVDHVGGLVSRVLLMSDPQSRIPVAFQNTQQEGVLYGSEEGKLYVSFLKHPQKLNKGDVVFSSGIDGYFPRGTSLGFVSHRVGEKVFVEPFVDFKSLHYVQIQKSHGGAMQ